MTLNCGHPVLDFSGSGIKGAGGRRLEMKVCEGGFCGGLRFVRDIPITAKAGAKCYPSCADRIKRETPAPRARVLRRPSVQDHWNREMSRLVM